MQHRYASLFRAAVFLLSLTVFAACRQEDKAVQPDTAQTEKLIFITENLEKKDLSVEDRTKAVALYTSLSFEEMEKLIDLRYQHSLKAGNVDAERAAYLRDLRRKLNRTAFAQKGKLFHQLDFAGSEEVIGMVNPGKRSGTPITGATTDAGGRTAGSCNVTVAPCTAWQSNGSIDIVGSDYPGDKVIDNGTFLGQRTFMCATNSYQNDCDYVYQYRYSKIYAAAGWKKTVPLFWISDPAATKTIDNNPNRVDCGTYTLQIMYGKFRIDEQFDKPETALNYLVLVLNRSIESLYCFTGTWGTEKWYYMGKYLPNMDGWGANGDQGGHIPCACTVENHVVY